MTDVFLHFFLPFIEFFQIYTHCPSIAYLFEKQNKMNVQSDTSAIIDDENLALLNSDNESEVSIRAACMYLI